METAWQFCHRIWEPKTSVPNLSRIFPDGLGNISSREKTSNNSKKRNFSIITSTLLCDFVLTPSGPVFLFAYARGEFSGPIDGGRIQPDAEKSKWLFWLLQRQSRRVSLPHRQQVPVPGPLVPLSWRTTLSCVGNVRRLFFESREGEGDGLQIPDFPGCRWSDVCDNPTRQRTILVH